MKKSYRHRPTWAEIDLGALEHNLRQAQGFCSAGQRIMAVVKADAYGHGAVCVTRALQSCGISDFAVATLEEALELRRAGIEDKLLVLGSCFPGQEQAFIAAELMPTLLDSATAERLEAAAAACGRCLKVHLKLDSGMGRVGFLPAQLGEYLPRLRQLEHLVVEGVMTHYACADALDSKVTADQQQCFATMLAMLRAEGIKPSEIHLANSAGLSAWPTTDCTLVRPGIMLYGGQPGPAFTDILDLRPVMHLRSRIAQLRTLPAGSGVSYGHCYLVQEDLPVAVLPIGYADGYNRLLSNRGQGILRGQIVPVIGRVCMDWIMLDVSNVPAAEVDDCVTLMGSADGLSVRGDDWAGQLDTIAYEVFCRIGSRVPRHYISDCSL